MKRTIRGQLREGDQTWEGRLGEYAQAAATAINRAKPNWDSLNGAMAKPPANEQERHTRPTERTEPAQASDEEERGSSIPFLHSVPEVNDVVGWRRFPCLPGEWERSGHGGPDQFQICPQTCLALRLAKARSASRGITVGDRTGVSRGRTTGIENRGDGIGPLKLGNPQARTGKDRTNIGEPTCAPPRHSNHRRVP